MNAESAEKQRGVGAEAPPPYFGRPLGSRKAESQYRSVLLKTSSKEYQPYRTLSDQVLYLILCFMKPMDVNPRSNASAEAPEGEYIVSLGDPLRAIWRRWWVILLTTVALTGIAVAFSLMQTPIYEASITVLIGQERDDSQPGNLGINVQGLQQLTQTMVTGINSRPVAEEVIRRQNLQIAPDEFLYDHLKVEQVANTQFIRVSYRDSSPQRAQQVANSVGEVFSEQVSEVSPSANAITATVWEQAQRPGEPASPDLVFNAILGLMAGLILGMGLAFLLEYLDEGWDSAEEVELISGVPTFGAIPEFEMLTGEKKASEKKAKH